MLGAWSVFRLVHCHFTPRQIRYLGPLNQIPTCHFDDSIHYGSEENFICQDSIYSKMIECDCIVFIKVGRLSCLFSAAAGASYTSTLGQSGRYRSAGGVGVIRRVLPASIHRPGAADGSVWRVLSSLMAGWCEWPGTPLVSAAGTVRTVFVSGRLSTAGPAHQLLPAVDTGRPDN